MFQRLSKMNGFTLGQKVLCLAFLLGFSLAEARDDDITIANKLHTRLTGLPPSKAMRDRLVVEISKGDIGRAADIIINEEPDFINITAKQFVAPFTNVSRAQDVILNDYIATGVGLIRDNIDFRNMLFGDVYYKVADTQVTAANNANIAQNPALLRAWSADNNNHYFDFERLGRKLSDTTQLVPGSSIATAAAPIPANKSWAAAEILGSQSGLRIATAANTSNQAPANWAMAGRPEATSGVLTTRASGEAYFKAGTNRRMWRFTLINYLCRDMENIHDTTQSDFMVRRDVARDPGSDSRVYKANCAGCHALQDALTPAYAYYDFPDNRLLFTPGQVVDKYIIHRDPSECRVPDPADATKTISRVKEPTQNSGALFPYCDLNNNNQYSANGVVNANEYYVDTRINFDRGFQVTSDKWINQLTGGANARIGWRDMPDTAGSNQSWQNGTGMKSLGKVIAASKGFSECMTQRVYQKVCVYPLNKSLNEQLKKISEEFESSGYRMKHLFSRVAETCVRTESEVQR